MASVRNHDDVPQIRQGKRAQKLQPARIGHAETSCRIIQNMAQLYLTILRIHQHNYAPGELDAQIGYDELRTIAQKKGNPLARTKSQAREGCGKATDLSAKIAIGQRLLFPEYHRSIRALPSMGDES